MVRRAVRITAPLLAGVILAGAAVAQTAAPPAALPAAPPLLALETDLLVLVAKAHPVVQAVMGLLVLSLVIVVTVLIYKMCEMALWFARLARSQRALGQRPGAPDSPCALAAGARAAQAELAAAPLHLTADLRASAQGRLDLALQRIEAGAVQRLRAGTGVLASIGAVGPFVGLFGTVFGIMNSFLAIAASRTTTLAVVAPGIAEALLATGLGLAAAIPAVLLYNHLMRRIQAYRHGLQDGLAQVQARFSRALDTRMGG